jgi:hypothetical protein
MSHSIQIQTKITNKAAAEKALQAQKWDFSSSDYSIRVTNGPLKGANIDLKTGKIVGDTDWHDKASLGALDQPYAEVLLMEELQTQGGFVESREVLKDGTIRIVATASYV